MTAQHSIKGYNSYKNHYVHNSRLCYSEEGMEKYIVNAEMISQETIYIDIKKSWFSINLTQSHNLKPNDNEGDSQPTIVYSGNVLVEDISTKM